MDHLFLSASRSKLRFSTNKGELTTEDLWDLSLTSLDNIARAVNRDLKASQEESFIVKMNSANATLELKLEILKHVIATKQFESEEKLNRRKKVEELELLESLLVEKETEGLKSLTPDQIRAKIAELKG